MRKISGQKLLFLGGAMRREKKWGDLEALKMKKSNDEFKGLYIYIIFFLT